MPYCACVHGSSAACRGSADNLTDGLPTAVSSGVKVMPSGMNPMVVVNTPLLCLSAELLGTVSSASTSSVVAMARLMTPAEGEGEGQGKRAAGPGSVLRLKPLRMEWSPDTWEAQGRNIASPN